MRDDHITRKSYPIHLSSRKDLRMGNNYFIYPRVRALERTRFQTK